MTLNQWKNNNKPGRFVARNLRRLETEIDKVTDAEVLIDRLRNYVYVWNTMAQIAKSDRDRELEERITELERLAAIAQKSVINK